MKLTVLVLNHFAAPPGSPGGTRHVELFSRLKKWSARVIASNRNLLDGGHVEPGGMLETVWVSPYEGNGPRRVLSWASYAATSFMRAVTAPRVDLIYGSSPHLLAGLSALVSARIRRVPFVLEVRDVWPQVLVDMGALAPSSPLYRLLEGLERLLYRQAARVVILAEGVAEHLHQRGVDPRKVCFIPNGADAADLQPSAPRDALRARYGFEGVVAVYAGAHGPANGLDLLLDAATQLAASDPDVVVALVGDGAEKQHLRERVRREQLSNVRFLDPVPKSEMGDVLGAADIGVHCLADVPLFRTGVSPNKLFDYMAAGLPVVTNTPGEVTAFVETSAGGLATEPRGLADGISELARSGAKGRTLLGSQGRRHLEATRSRSAMAERLERLLDEVIAESRRD